MANSKQEQAGASQQEQAGTDRIKVNKLNIKKETIKELSNHESKGVNGGGKTTACTDFVTCDCITMGETP